ncbi:MAG: sigma-70 family RNA polymerase sigma factor [Solibacillus sp.]
MQNVEQLIFENETLIKKVIYKLKIYRDLDEYMQVGRIALWQALQKFDDTKGDFTMFAYMTVKYAIIRSLAKANHVSEHELAVEEDVIIINSRQHNLVASSLEWPEWFEELNEDEQFLLIALYEKELSLKEIADKYKLSYETIKKRRQRLLSKLRGLLK